MLIKTKTSSKTRPKIIGVFLSGAALVLLSILGRRRDTHFSSLVLLLNSSPSQLNNNIQATRPTSATNDQRTIIPPPPQLQPEQPRQQQSTLQTNDADAAPLPRLESLLLSSPKDYPPLSCPTVLQHEAALDPNQGVRHVAKTDHDPVFSIALHNEQFDRTRWSILRAKHYYETDLANAFHTVLDVNSTTTTTTTKTTRRVLDVGGNIGYFSLFSAHHANVIVETFEPNLKNAFRLCQSLDLNGLLTHEYSTTTTTTTETTSTSSTSTSSSNAKQSRVNVYPYGVGQDVGKLQFQEHKANPGMGRFDAVSNNSDNNNNAEGSANSIPVVSLDAFATSRGWLSSSTTIAILKIDTEGFEHFVIRGAQQLLQRRLVEHIFMEISARNNQEILDATSTVRQLATAGYNVHQYGGYRGPRHTVNWSHKNVTQLVSLVMHKVTKKKHPQMNLWWMIG